ncbi:Gly-Xaa carboxypeptidase [Sporothrix schenckii 1099-18]|uniref:Gly-Xaa carboxypeptidase n=1 Tax=Sporothrix schenckii 1099-18 TaxID=1397361 RepID=A0A0F2MIS7_SPOSC|nr:Gly-Xaa carboxypeptidase [Sporothrix schenckii 1099-18]KJR88076.1 Gly-Xaa carboxypeptidase [Sporothrix schenckii 1099-18]
MKFNGLRLLFLSAATPALAAVLATSNPDDSTSHQHVIGGDHFDSDRFTCDLPPPVAPPASDGLPSADELFGSAEARELQAHRLAAAVRVPSVSYDDMQDVDVDPRWVVFADLHRVFEALFPVVHRRMTVTKINQYGLVFSINGSDTSLRPILLTGHQDVVPVPDPSAWTHPPFSGYFDGTWLWGRGAADDKSSVTALLSVAEALLAQEDWTPRRTLILAFGFDEESLGERGAGAINKHLEAVYGHDSMVLLLDEGGSGLDLVPGRGDGDEDTLFALPGVAEKGQINVFYELRTRGGHSSMPLPHTAIGIAAEIVAALEAHAYAPKLVEGSPLHNNYVCRARYSPDADRNVTRLVANNELAALADLLASYDPMLKFRLQTSQAVDIIHAGLKINAMPEKVEMGVNYRVAPHESLDTVKQRTVELLQPIVAKYSIALTAFGKEVKAAADTDTAASVVGADSAVHAQYDVDYDASLVVTAPMELPVAPITPTTGPVWDLFSGTIQHTFAFDGGRVVPVGDIMNGNTDTRSYLGLTRNVFRWEPLRATSFQNMHAIDEAMHIDGHMEAVRFYYNLVRNFDAADV